MGEPVRLTRRGRIVVITLLAALLLGGLWLTAERGAFAGGPQKPRQTVVVDAEDTLWEIAARHRPQTDPRVTVHRIIEINGLRDALIEPGQELQLPR